MEIYNNNNNNTIPKKKVHSHTESNLQQILEG